MDYELSLEHKAAYLHATVKGDNTPQNVERYLSEIRRECMARGCRRVLVEERLRGDRLGTADVFSIVMEESARAAGLFDAIAYVDVHAGGDMMKFAESVAAERGIPVRLFATLAEAEQWLTRAAR